MTLRSLCSLRVCDPEVVIYKTWRSHIVPFRVDCLRARVRKVRVKIPVNVRFVYYLRFDCEALDLIIVLRRL